MIWLLALQIVTAGPWIDLGDEGATVILTASFETPPPGEARALVLATGAGQQRVSLGIDEEGRWWLWLYRQVVYGEVCEPGRTMRVAVQITSHAKSRDEARLWIGPADQPWPDTLPEAWPLANDQGDSAADLDRVLATPAAAIGSFTDVRVGSDWVSATTGPTVAPGTGKLEIRRPPKPLNLSPPDPATNPDSALMLNLPATGTDDSAIDYDTLPRLAGEHAVVSTGDEVWRFRLHNYLAWHDGQYVCIWSHGPVIEDRATQHVRYATSPDGLAWSEAKTVVGAPEDGWGYIARGLWQRDGELLALASKFVAPGYAGKGLRLEGFRWTGAGWAPIGVVADDTLNNFAPKRLPSGEWMMTRRDWKRDVSVLVGGVKAIDDWQVRPLAVYRDEAVRPEEPYWYTLPDGQSIVGLFRNNAGQRLLRAFSTDDGRSWSPLVETNFPDATSKFNVLRTSRGYYVLVSNANPARRNPLCLSVSRDGLVYTRMAVLPIPAEARDTLQYPHVIEHDGQLLIAFSRNKTGIEVARVALDAVDALWEDGAP